MTPRRLIPLAAASLLAAAPASAAEIQVFAAASLTNALREIAAVYERDSGDRVRFNFAASSTLGRQIAEGAPADLFVSADEAQMDALETAGRLVPGTRHGLLSNRLVVVAPSDSQLVVAGARDLTSPLLRRLALAEPRSVPAGVYAREYLLAAGVWAALEARVVPTENVRAALAAVEAGNADAAIVYATDAMMARRVRVLHAVPPEEAPAISYPLALVRSGRELARGRVFAEYLGTAAVGAIFERHGFILRPAENRGRRGGRGAATSPAWEVLALTLRTALLAVALILAPGLALAWLLARRSWPGKSVVETLVALPLVMPPVATGLLLLRLLGRRGPLGGWLERTLGLEVVFTRRAVVAAMAVMALPLLVRSARHAFESVDPRLEQVARTLGASWPRVLREVTLPLARRGILGGALLAFARALGEFGATIVVAGNVPGRTQTLALAIYGHIQLGEDGQAYRLLAVSAIVAFAALWTAEWFLRRRSVP